jgi:outer membrane lipoprotein-sorting protein
MSYTDLTGNTITYQFTRQKLGVKIRPGSFRFDPPPGTRIIDLSDPAPPKSSKF